MWFKCIASLSCLFALTSSAQFVIDAAGPHNILPGSEKLKDKNTLQFGLDTANRSISIGYLRAPQTNNSTFVYAFSANVGVAKGTKIQDIWDSNLTPALGPPRRFIGRRL